MGYCMSQRESRFRIDAAKMADAFSALNTLAMKAPAQGRGHFSWVNTATLHQAQSLQDHLDEWRWEPSFDPQGNLIEVSFTGEKLGDDKALFDALAPFVTSGSFIVMQGEDGEMWRWVFDGTRCVEQSASVSFGDLPSDVIDAQARDVTPESRPGRLLSIPPRLPGR